MAVQNPVPWHKSTAPGSSHDGLWTGMGADTQPIKEQAEGGGKQPGTVVSKCYNYITQRLSVRGFWLHTAAPHPSLQVLTSLHYLLLLFYYSLSLWGCRYHSNTRILWTKLAPGFQSSEKNVCWQHHSYNKLNLHLGFYLQHLTNFSEMGFTVTGEGGPSLLQFGEVIYLLASYYMFYNKSELIIKTVPLDSKICVSMTTVNAAAWFRDQHCNTELCISLVSSTLRNHLNGWTEQAHRNLNRDTGGKEEDLFCWLQYKKW